MWLFKRFTVKKNERGLLLRNGDFERMLAPGKHTFFSLADRLTVEVYAIDKAPFLHPLADYLMAREPDVVEAEFDAVTLSESEVGLRFENGVLVEILAPATRRLFWKGLVASTFQIIDLREGPAMPPDLVGRLTQTQLRQRNVAGQDGVLKAPVPEGMAGLLQVDGQWVDVLKPGNHAFWKYGRQVSVEFVDLRMQVMEVSGQEIMTRDKVALRLNLNAGFRFLDPLQAFRALQKPLDYLYRELQFALRAAVGTRTLDALLEDKTVIDDVVSAHMARKLASVGLQLDSVGVKDIVLPGDMKTILAQVVQAEKQAQANVIRRREETAATRSLLNTAKVMEDNPVALRMKELETLERVAERIDRISVVGGLDQVLNGLVSIKPT
ncbi:slipin family protein [Hydrogenophaga sp. 5NK40-0174]|uniref:slipin family protein n=1 Tax=Hydrogenophaga sp. 5NK40-0174 TaxID=3127649 RepID=UPI00310A0A0D